MMHALAMLHALCAAFARAPVTKTGVRLAMFALFAASVLGAGQTAQAQNRATTNPDEDAVERTQPVPLASRTSVSPNESDDTTPVVRATGGLRSSLGEADDSGRRYITASQLSAEDEAALRRFAIDPDGLTTGSIGDQPDLDRSTPRSASALDQDDAYAALGIRAGPLTWFPAIDLAVGYNSNPDSVSDAREVYTVRLSPELRVVSDWRRHQWNASIAGTIEYLDDGRDVGGSLNAQSDLQLDLGVDTTVSLRGGYELTGEPESDPDAVAGADGTTLTHELRGGFGVSQRFGLVNATASVDVSRFLFDETDLVVGGVQSNDDRNRYDGTATLRLERTEGPILRPFVEGSITLRRFDDARDRNGFARDSLGYALRGGLTISDDGPLRGSFAIGLVGEELDDDRLDSATTVDVQASLTWDVTALTSVTLDVGTDLDPTTQAGAGVGINRTAALGLTHAIRRNVDLRLGAEVSDTDFTGTGDDTRVYTARAGLTWQLSRVAAFRLDGRYEHEPNGEDIDRVSLEAGITLRR